MTDLPPIPTVTDEKGVCLPVWNLTAEQAASFLGITNAHPRRTLERLRSDGKLRAVKGLTDGLRYPIDELLRCNELCKEVRSESEPGANSDKPGG